MVCTTELEKASFWKIKACDMDQQSRECQANGSVQIGVCGGRRRLGVTMFVELKRKRRKTTGVMLDGNRRPFAISSIRKFSGAAL